MSPTLLRLSLHPADARFRHVALGFSLLLTSISAANAAPVQWPALSDMVGPGIPASGIYAELPYTYSSSAEVSYVNVLTDHDFYDVELMEAWSLGYELIVTMKVDFFEDNVPPDPDILADLAQGMSILADRYDGSNPELPRVRYWRLGNEVNNAGFHVDPATYWEVVRTLSPIVRLHDAEVVVSIAGWDGDDTWITNYLRDVLESCPPPCEQNFPSYVDVYDVHIYGQSYSTTAGLDDAYRHFATVPDAIDVVLAEYDSGPGSYLTVEQGTYSGEPAQGLPLQSDDNHAEDTIRRLVVMGARSYRLFVLQTMDSYLQSHKLPGHVGLAHDGAFPDDPGYRYRKSAFYSTQRLTTRLSPMTTVTGGLTASGGKYIFGRPEASDVAILWNDTGAPRSETLEGTWDVVTSLVRPAITDRIGDSVALPGGEPVAVESAFDVPGEYPTIGAAVIEASASGGGVVRVEPGTYVENLTLTDGVEIYGKGSDTTIQGLVSAGSARGFVLSAVKLANGTSTAFSCTGCSGIVSDVVFTGNGSPTMLADGDGLKVVRCRFDGGNPAILSNDGGPLIAASLFYLSTRGIDAAGTSEPIVANNVFYMGSSGVRVVTGGLRTRIRGNIFSHVPAALECLGNGAKPSVTYNDLHDSPSSCISPLVKRVARLESKFPGPYNVKGKTLRLALDEPATTQSALVPFANCLGDLCTTDEVVAEINGVGAALVTASKAGNRLVISSKAKGATASVRAARTFNPGPDPPPPNAANDLGLPVFMALGSGANIDDDPAFASPGADFHLSSGSPCVDKGDPQPLQNDLGGSRNDIGMWGGPESR